MLDSLREISPPVAIGLIVAFVILLLLLRRTEYPRRNRAGQAAAEAEVYRAFGRQDLARKALETDAAERASAGQDHRWRKNDDALENDDDFEAAESAPGSGLRLIVLVLVLLGVFLWVAAPDMEFSRDDLGVPLDMAVAKMPLPRPVLESEVTLVSTVPPPDSLREVLGLRRAFFAGDFERLDAALAEARSDHPMRGRDHARARAIVKSIAETQLAGLELCDDWLREMPGSYAAHWVCGAIWQRGAWAVRGGGYADKVGGARFALMGERLARSDALLSRALELADEPFEVLTMLADNHLANGSKGLGATYLEQAERMEPRYLSIHRVRLNYAQPQWGGSEQRVREALARAKAAGVGKSDLLDLEDDFLVQPWKRSTPGAARAYWESAISAHPTRNRLSNLLEDFVRLQNWHDGLPVAKQLINLFPDDANGYYHLALINENLGRTEDARKAYRNAAAMGHDLALQALIMAHVRGGLGLPGKSFAEVAELCLHGAALGSSVGANCLGASYLETDRAGVPFYRDPPQGLAWHVQGARAGHFNSQFDLGWMLYTGRVPGVESAQAKRLGIFWLRRAAAQNHQFALRKLEELGIGRSESPLRVLSARWDPEGMADRVVGIIGTVQEKLLQTL